jgi:hypothetical protein
MHDSEKSDSGIVVTKPTNKAGRPVAEPVEPRPGTKGNADQQSTHRAQSRARVTQALGRVRQAARQRKGTVHRAPPPYQYRYAPDGVLRAYPAIHQDEFHVASPNTKNIMSAGPLIERLKFEG